MTTPPPTGEEKEALPTTRRTGRGRHVRLSKELNCWVYLGEDIGGHGAAVPVAIAYVPPSVWQQERWGRYVFAPALGLAGAATLFASTQQASANAQIGLQVAGAGLICTALYKGLLDQYLQDHAKQIDRCRDYLLQHRTWSEWAEAFDPPRPLSSSSSSSLSSSLSVLGSFVVPTGSLRIEDYLTPLERGNFYTAHASVDLTRLDIPGSALANLNGLFECGAISRPRYEQYRRISLLWSSKEDEKAKKQAHIEDEYDKSIEQPLAAFHRRQLEAHAEYESTPCIAALEKLRALLRSTQQAIEARSGLYRAMIRAIPPTPDKKDPSSRENLERRVVECAEIELKQIEREFEYQEATVRPCCNEASRRLNEKLAQAEATYYDETRVPTKRRERQLEDMNDEYVKLDSRLQSQLEERTQQADRQDQVSGFAPPRHTVHSSVPEDLRDQVTLAVLDFMSEQQQSN